MRKQYQSFFKLMLVWAKGKAMNILITGASGFIGSYLVKHLSDHGHNLITITRKKDYDISKTKTITGDITNPKSLEPAFQDTIDAVIHNAAYANDYGKDPRYYQFNVQGTRNIAELCKKYKVNHLLYTSTAGIYGFPNNTIPIKESHGPTPKPFNAYGATKIESEKVLKEYTTFKKTIFRPPMVFGAGGKPALILLTRIKENKMTYIGRDEKTITVAHPADVGQCFRLALEKQIEGEFNTVSFTCTIQELVEKSAEKLNVTPPTRHIPFFLAYLTGFFIEKLTRDEPNFTRFRAIKLGTSRIIDGKKAEEILGFKPQYDLDKTVEDMVSWYQSLIK